MLEPTEERDTKAEYDKLFFERFGYLPSDMEEFTVPHYAEPRFGIQIKTEGHTMRVHPKSACLLPYQCVIHNPSDHHMREWPLNWRADTQVMERICPDGVGHPDPDDLAFQEMVGNGWKANHGCDGCCVGTH